VIFGLCHTLLNCNSYMQSSVCATVLEAVTSSRCISSVKICVSFPSSENARVLVMTHTGDGPVVNIEDALAENRKTLSK
jgi:hypothetical protein